MKRRVLLAIESIPSSYLGQHIVHLHSVTKFKSWTLGFSLRVPNRLVRSDTCIGTGCTGTVATHRTATWPCEPSLSAWPTQGSLGIIYPLCYTHVSIVEWFTVAFSWHVGVPNGVVRHRMRVVDLFVRSTIRLPLTTSMRVQGRC